MCLSKPAESPGFTRYRVMKLCSRTRLWIESGPFLLRYQSENCASQAWETQAISQEMPLEIKSWWSIACVATSSMGRETSRSSWLHVTCFCIWPPRLSSSSKYELTCHRHHILKRLSSGGARAGARREGRGGLAERDHYCCVRLRAEACWGV